MTSIFSQLPFDIIREILLYNSHFVFRKDKKQLICIDKIPNSDPRFLLYNTIPRIYERNNHHWSVILGTYPRFVMSRRYRVEGAIWEYSFVTFHKDQHTNMINYIPLYSYNQIIN